MKSGRLLLAGGAALAAYLLLLRPAHLRWGATPEEAREPLPGDWIIKLPSINATRALHINARPDEVWPWLVQVGFGRAGWYSYDWLDNLGRPSASRILPEFQNVHPGDFVPMGMGLGFRVAEVDAPRLLLWNLDDQVSWVWSLRPVGDEHTRLVTRMRVRYPWNKPTLPLYLAFDAGDFVMMRRMLLGIRERAERLAAARRAQMPSLGHGWKAV